VHKQEKPMLEPSASHNEYNMYTYVFLRKFGIWQKIIPPTKEHVQQLTTVCNWFIWQGAIFRVPVTTLQLPKEQGD